VQAFDDGKNLLLKLPGDANAIIGNGEWLKATGRLGRDLDARDLVVFAVFQCVRVEILQNLMQMYVFDGNHEVGAASHLGVAFSNRVTEDAERVSKGPFGLGWCNRFITGYSCLHIGEEIQNQAAHAIRSLNAATEELGGGPIQLCALALFEKVGVEGHAA